jgi:hypothetical protein
MLATNYERTHLLPKIIPISVGQKTHGLGSQIILFLPIIQHLSQKQQYSFDTDQNRNTAKINIQLCKSNGSGKAKSAREIGLQFLISINIYAYITQYANSKGFFNTLLLSRTLLLSHSLYPVLLQIAGIC